MRSRNRVNPDSNVYFITTSTHLWVPILFNESLFQIILDSFVYCQKNKGLNLHGFVIMINHFHAIISHESHDQISNVVRDIKRHTAIEIRNYLSEMGEYSQLFWVKRFHDSETGKNKIWQEGYHPIAIKSQEVFSQKLEYIHNNPVKKGFVEKPEDWKYSSARNYLLGDESLITLDELA